MMMMMMMMMAAVITILFVSDHGHSRENCCCCCCCCCGISAISFHSTRPALEGRRWIFGAPASMFGVVRFLFLLGGTRFARDDVDTSDADVAVK